MHGARGGVTRTRKPPNTMRASGPRRKPSRPLASFKQQRCTPMPSGHRCPSSDATAGHPGVLRRPSGWRPACPGHTRGLLDRDVAPSVPSSSGKSLNGPISVITTTKPFSPLIIGEVAQPVGRLGLHSVSIFPSVPSSSGKSLNSSLQKPRYGAGFRTGFETAPRNGPFVSRGVPGFRG